MLPKARPAVLELKLLPESVRWSKVALALAAGTFGLVGMLISPRTGMWCAVILMGASQVGGLCGTAHFTTMQHLWNQAPRSWLTATAIYTASGTFSSLLVGVVLGLLGRLALAIPISWRLGAVLAVGAVMLARELGLLNIWMPDNAGRTNRAWAHEFGWCIAAAMWGFHIGLAFVTVVTYGGFWVLALFVCAAADPWFGAAAMVVYWLGRTVPLWSVPLVQASCPVVASKTYPLFRPVHAAGLAALCVAVLLGVGR